MTVLFHHPIRSGSLFWGTIQAALLSLVLCIQIFHCGSPQPPPTAAGPDLTPRKTNKETVFFRTELLRRLEQVFRVKTTAGMPLSGLWTIDQSWMAQRMEERLKERYGDHKPEGLQQLLEKLKATATYLSLHPDGRFYLLTIPPNLRTGGTSGMWKKFGSGLEAVPDGQHAIRYRISSNGAGLVMEYGKQQMFFVRSQQSGKALMDSWQDKLDAIIHSK
jgi:hypothetical protein